MHTPTAAVIRLREDAYTAWADRLGLVSEGAMADHIGIDRTVLNRVRRGEIKPGEQFIAACLVVYDGTFEELFEVTG